MTRQTYYYKATKDGGVSGYSDDFVYKLGWNEEPDADLESKEACGVGLHLAKTVLNAIRYVDSAMEFYFAYPDKVLGGDDTKIRTNRANLLLRIPDELIDDYIAKHNLLINDYDAGRRLLVDNYEAKCKLLSDDFWAELKLLNRELYKKCKALIK